MWEARSYKASPNPNATEQEETEKLAGGLKHFARVRNPGDLSRSASPSVVAQSYPVVSLRQQLAMVKQLEQPSPCGSTDGTEGSGPLATTPNTSSARRKERVAKVHKRNTRGETPLHVAARKGDYRMCEKLLTDGADVNCRDYAGWTALHEACSHNAVPTVKVLLKYGADVNLNSEDNDSPLHDAVTSNNVEIVWLLLSRGAARDCRNSDGQLPLDKAEAGSKTLHLLMQPQLPDRCPSPESESEASASADGSPPDTRAATPATANCTTASSGTADWPQQPPTPQIIFEQLPTGITQHGPKVPLNQPISVSIDSPCMVASTLSPAPPARMTSTLSPAPSAKQTVSTELFTSDPKEATAHSGLELELSESSSSSTASPPKTGTTGSPEEEAAPRAATSGSQSTEEAVDAEGAEAEMDALNSLQVVEEQLAVQEQGQDRLVVGRSTRQRSADPEFEPTRTARQAVWKTERSGPLLNPSSALHSAYDFVEESEESRDEVRSESGGSRRRGGRGSRGRKSTRGIGRAGNVRGGGARSTTAHTAHGGRLEAAVADATQILVNDPYDFRSSPESEVFSEMIDEREQSAPPSVKKARLQEEPDSTAASVVGDLDMDTVFEEDDSFKSVPNRKVPPLRISLMSKPPSEEDPEEDSGERPAAARKPVARGRPGKRPHDAHEDAQRITRSKVRQKGGGGIDDLDHLPNKKKRGIRVHEPLPPTTLLEDVVSEDPIHEELTCNVSSKDADNDASQMNDVSPAQNVLMLAPPKASWKMKKMLCQRWAKDLSEQSAKEPLASEQLEEEHGHLSIYTKEYPLAGNDHGRAERGPMPDCLPEMRSLWIEQDEERRRTWEMFRVETARLRISMEESFLVHERRRRGTNTLMSAVRFIKEAEICNPLVLDQEAKPLNVMSKEELILHYEPRVMKVFRRQKLDTSELMIKQREEWQKRARALKAPVQDLVSFVPSVAVEKLEVDFSKP